MGDRCVSALQSFHNQDSISYLSQREAAEIDETLMGPLGFSVDQLMVSLSVFLWISLFFRNSLDCIWIVVGTPFHSWDLQELAGLSVATSIAEVVLFFSSLFRLSLFSCTLFVILEYHHYSCLDQAPEKESLADWYGWGRGFCGLTSCLFSMHSLVVFLHGFNFSESQMMFHSLEIQAS